MRDLPTGTVTLLFTDIEGSTRLLHELGEGYAEVLAEHRRLLRESFTRHAGAEVDTQGDAHLAVFRGGFSLDAAETVCDTELDPLATLVDMSLLKSSGDARFLMLETIREYACERLRQSGDEGEVARQHCAWYATLAEEIDDARFSQVPGADTAGRWISEQANLRAAVGWARDAGEVVLQLRILTAASDVFLRSSQRAFREQLEQALAGEVDDMRLRARAEARLSFTTYRQGDYRAARAAAERGLALGREVGDPQAVGSSLSSLANLATAAGRFEEAKQLYEQEADVTRAAGDGRGIGINLVNRGDLALAATNYEEAVELLLEAIEVARAHDDEATVLVGAINLATAYVHLDRLHEAEERASEALAIARGQDDLVAIATTLGIFAAIAVRRGEGGRCARLIGAGERIREGIDLSLEPSEQVLYDDVVERLKSLQGPRENDVLIAAGRSLSVAEAISEALEES